LPQFFYLYPILARGGGGAAAPPPPPPHNRVFDVGVR
jgi:hypothetical protein